MSLGVSVVETLSADDYHDPYNVFSNEISEKSRYGSFFYCTDPSREPRSFTNYELNIDDLVNSIAEHDTRHAWNDSISEIDVKGSRIVILGDGLASLELVDAFGKCNDVTVFNGTIEDQENLKLSNADYYILAFTNHTGEEEEDEMFNITELKSALNKLEPFLQPQATVIIESRVPVGTTRLLLEPLIRSKRIKGGISPKYAPPLNTLSPIFPERSKLIAGLDDLMPGSLASIHSLYTATYPDIISVSRPEDAEMATVLHGDGQPAMVATAYANEMADACAPVGVDPFEVCSVLSRSPISSEPCTPIVGMGGMYTGSFFNYIGSVSL